MKPQTLSCAVLLWLGLTAAAIAQVTPNGAHPDTSAAEASPAPSGAPPSSGPPPSSPPEESIGEKSVDPSSADEKPAPSLNGTSESICMMIESAAEANRIPVDFFARVIWRESRFRADAVGPVTRSGEQAQGIAQFMPRTASERRLLDPFDPVQALPKSAEFLRELFEEFGNLGLAAAGYNAGPRRVHDWLDGRGSLPHETLAYVLAVTGRPAEDWIPGRDVTAGRGGKAGQPTSTSAKTTTCRDLMALLKRAPTPFVTELERRVQQGAGSPWGIELSAGFSRELVLRTYAAIERKYGALLAGNDPSIFAATFRNRGNHTFYQIRIGAATRAEANGICSKLERAGGACMVLRNPVGQAHEALSR